MKKKEKALKALKLLLIGEVMIALGLLGELGAIVPMLGLIALISIVGMIVALVGIIKLARVNIFFLISCLALATSLLFGITLGALTAAQLAKDTLDIVNTLFSIAGKGLSCLFIFGIIRGCSKAATGSARSKIATVMTLVNFFGKALAIVFTILAGVYEKSNQTLSNAFVLVSTILTIIVDIYFVYYLFIVYRKAEALVKKTAN